jgi:hypothetical protein
MRSRCALSMLACTLNTNPENGASRARAPPSTSRRRAGRGTRSITASSSRRTPKLVRAEPKNTGVVSPARNSLVVVGADLVEQLELLVGVGPQLALLGLGPGGVDVLLGGDRVAPPGGAGEADEVTPVARSITPRKSPAMPTGQVTGVGIRPSWLSISSSSSSGSRPGRSHLLMKVRSGRPRSRHTSNSFRVCGSMPLAASSTMTAPSQAASTR